MRQIFGKKLALSFVILYFLQQSLPLKLYASPATSDYRPVISYDSEIRQLIKDYIDPLVKAAQLKTELKIILELSNIPNAGTDGKHLIIFTGLISFAKTPNQVINVLAHEVGHAKYGHSAKKIIAKNAIYIPILKGLALGAFNVASLGLIFGNFMELFWKTLAVQDILFSLLLSNVKYNGMISEIEADRAGLSLLAASRQSSKGSLEFMQMIADSDMRRLLTKEERKYKQSLAPHPPERERIIFLANQARRSPFFGKKDPPALIKRHLLAQGKIIARLAASDQQKERIYQYFLSQTAISSKERQLALAYSLANYAVLSKKSDALKQVKALIKKDAPNPFFHELLADAYYNQQDFSAAIYQYQKAIKLFEQSYNNKANDLYYKLGKSFLKRAPSKNSAKLKLLKRYRAKKDIDSALKAFISAQKIITERPEPYYYAAQAAGLKGEKGLAQYFLSEMYFQLKDHKQARILAARSLKNLAKTSLYRAKAQDILNYDPKLAF